LEAITWTNEKRKLSDLIPWPKNPRQIKEPEARRLVGLHQLGLNCYRSAFGFFMALNAKSNKVHEVIRPFIIPVENMRRGNMVDVQTSWLFERSPANLTFPVVAPDCLPSLASPVKPVGYSSSVTMNKSRVSYANHVLSPAQNRTTYIFSAFRSGLRNTKHGGANGAGNINSFHKLCSTTIRLMFKETFLRAKNSVFSFCGRKDFLANRTRFFNPGRLLGNCRVIFRITIGATKIKLSGFNSIWRKCKRFIAIGAFYGDLVSFHRNHLKKEPPSGWRCYCLGNTNFSRWGACLKNISAELDALPRQFKYTTLGYGLQS
jgi:hypothetical protein